MRDSGIGMTAEAQDHLGQAWFQVDHATPQSSGLGLAICHQLVKLMAGTLHLTSQEGEGTEVVVRLPLERTQQQPVDTLVIPAPLPRQHVLVVDDFPPNLTVLRLQLEKLGMLASCCGSAEEALDFLARQSVDILITDCQMPQMDGYELVQTLLIRDLLGQGAAPTVILGCTANALPREEERARHVGMDDLLRKPLTATRLQQSLAQHNPETRQAPDLEALHALANQQPEVIELMRQQMHDAIRADLALLTGTPPAPEELSRIAHRLKASWSLLGMPAALRACLVLESLPEALESGRLAQVDIQTLIRNFSDVMQQSLAQLDAALGTERP